MTPLIECNISVTYRKNGAGVRDIAFSVGRGEISERIQLDDNDPLPHGMTIWQGMMWYCDDVGIVCRLKL